MTTPLLSLSLRLIHKLVPRRPAPLRWTRTILRPMVLGGHCPEDLCLMEGGTEEGPDPARRRALEGRRQDMSARACRHVSGSKGNVRRSRQDE